MRTSDVRSAMAARTTDELRAICTEDAPEYAAEAIEIARAELVGRGVDVTGLVARSGEARDAVPTPVRRAGMLWVGALIACIAITLAFESPTSPVASALYQLARVAAFFAFVGLVRERLTRSAPPKPRSAP